MARKEAGVVLPRTHPYLTTASAPSSALRNPCIVRLELVFKADRRHSAAPCPLAQAWTRLVALGILCAVNTHLCMFLPLL